MVFSVVFSTYFSAFFSTIFFTTFATVVFFFRMLARVLIFLNPDKTEPFNQFGFTQPVHIFSKDDPSIVWRGTVHIDPGNQGPNLITEEAMRFVHGHPTGPGTTIRTYDGEEKSVGGEVELCFSGPGPRTRYHRRKFRHVPHIIDGTDMVLNHDFYIEVFPEKVPGMLMIRAGGKKETKEQKRIREQARLERQRQREDKARVQEAERREEIRVAEERRQAREAEYYYC